MEQTEIAARYTGSASVPGTTGTSHDWRVFFRQWARHPHRTAAVAPSSRELAALMVAQLRDSSADRVVELGPGTGTFTRALLDSGVARSRLLLVEINHELAALLRRRFPGVEVACANACDLARLCKHCKTRPGRQL